MFLFERDLQCNPAEWQKHGREDTKTWLDIGNGKEALVSQVTKRDSGPPPRGPNYGKLITNRKYTAFSVGDYIYYAGIWTRVEEVKDSHCTIRSSGKQVTIPFAQCIREIPIHVLVCSSLRTYMYTMLVKGRKALKQLGAKLAKHNDMQWSKATWYYNGNKLHEETRVEGVNIKPDGKILCMLLEFEMRTFKRFRHVDEGQGWHMNKDKADGINFTPSQPVSLFGFGMYLTREGPPAFLIAYQVLLYDSPVKSDSVLVNKVTNDQMVMPIFFSEKKEPLMVDAGMKVTIIIQYFDYEDSSRLFIGRDGSDYDSIEGNEPGLFKLEKHPESQNGTDLANGQLPELYYALAL